MHIINLTQHQPTPEQVQAGVSPVVDEVKALLNFSELPSFADLYERANKIAQIAKESGTTHAMIGGAPFFMRYLEDALLAVNILPVYAFSKRVSIEAINEDNSISKTSVFKHIGFVEV